MADQETRFRMGLCLAFVVTLSMCNGFNLDPRFSITKRGSERDYFGYSVSEHQIVDNSGTGSVTENLLLVGAPRENISDDSPKLGGAIYKCNASSTWENDCERLDKETFVLSTQDMKLRDSWLGVVLQSYGKGQKIVTCGHRYIQGNSALGICYTLEQSLEYMSTWLPCQGKSHTNYLEDFGLCQAGLSAKLGPRDALLMGAPGSVFWRGAVFQANTSDVLGTVPGPFSSPIDETPPGPPTDKYSYLGYSVEMGKFDASQELYYVSGAPRAHETGEVVFFQKNRGLDLHYKPEQKLKGDKDFAGFGSALLALDLNNDSFDDLIVGAPYFYEKGRGGAIYIYYGSKKMIDNKSNYKMILSREMSGTECEELGCEHARFGMSLAKLGDINNDGYQDFAVGAPYEGNGTLYIYHGSKDGVSDMYAQRISASDMPDGETLKSFGYSLSGGLDLDGNGYPDLLVGSYESGTISLLRTQAIIELQAEVTVTPNKIDLKSDTAQQLQIMICLNFTAEPKDRFTSRPIIKYQMEAERTRNPARLDLLQSQDASKKVVTGSMELEKQQTGRQTCDFLQASVKEGITDKLNPIELTVQFSLSLDEYNRPIPGARLPDINMYPVLSTKGVALGAEPNTVSALVDFVKECGPDNECLSNLQFEVSLDQTKDGNKYILRDGEFSRVNLTITITNVAEAAYLTQVYVQKPPMLSYQSVSGRGQDANVSCIPSKDKTLIVCTSIGNPLKKGSSVTFNLTLNNKISTSDNLMNITTWVNTSSTEQTPQNDRYVLPFVVIREADLYLSVNVRPDDQILCSGDPRGASAMQSEKDIGPAVNHSFIVNNRGPSEVPRSTLTIEWPYEVGGDGVHGKFLLYLMEAPIVESGIATCSNEPDTVNPLGIPSVRAASAPVTVDRVERLDSRKKRSANRVKRAQTGGKVILGCKQKTARCRKITCALGPLRTRGGYVKITLRARLWESTLLQDYRKSGDVEIRSYGYLSIDPLLKIQQTTDNDEKEAITSAVPDFKESGTEAVEWWWILLAVLGGILLLVLIIFILYKVGFFKRKRPEDMRMYQAEKKQAKMIDDCEDEME